MARHKSAINGTNVSVIRSGPSHPDMTASGRTTVDGRTTKPTAK